jgi:SagB-type dehydrogenase family enzyme
MLPYEDPHSLASLFHLNSEPWNNVAAYDDPHSHTVEYKTVGAREDAIALPPAGSSPLMELIAARRSCREFVARDLELRRLASVLDAAYGMTGLRDFPDGRRVFGRAVPSAGGLYPLELYVLADRVEGMKRGLYHYHARDRVLEPLFVESSVTQLLPDLMNQQVLEGASAIVFLSAVFARTQGKYGARGYRYILLEAGHAVQNVCLRAVELGLATLCIGGYTDARINALLKLDGRSEGVVYAVAVGHAGPAPGGGPSAIESDLAVRS